jgi:acetoin utilization protein AcuB
MFVSNWMTKEPIAVTPDDFLINAKGKMEAGKFHRLPVVSEGRLVGIITDLDMRAHAGYLAKTKVNGAMTEKALTVSPSATLEEAARKLLKHQIGGLPVVDKGQLVGIITTSDVMKAFLYITGASDEASTRIDFALEGEEHGLTEASRIAAREGGEILGVGKFGENPVCYLRVLSGNAERVAEALRAAGFDILGVHGTGS